MKFLKSWLVAALFFSGIPVIAAPKFIRKPFLQLGTPTSAAVCWKTDSAAVLHVRFGTDSSRLDRVTKPSLPTTDFCASLDSLQPATKYFYEAYRDSTPVQGSPSQYLVTAPLKGTKGRKFTFWLLGDFGIGAGLPQYPTFGHAALKVRDAFLKVNGSSHVDGFLMLGDIAYESGTEAELNAGTFDVYPEVMATSFSWPAMGNHETYTVASGGPYLSAFTLPSQGQAGGVPSNSEYYYSYNYGNIHFIVLEFEVSSRLHTGSQYEWLYQDLQSASAREADWIIVYAHHNAYTRGTHSSETESQLVDIRYNFMPLLEQYGADFFISGHSHTYERSYLLNGAYSIQSVDLDSHNVWYAKNWSRVVLDSTSGDPLTTGPYRKLTGGNNGTVYIVAGSGGKLGSSGRHPMMRVNHKLQGSVLLEIQDSVATARFIDTTGTIRDHFQVIKSAPPPPPPPPPPPLGAAREGAKEGAPPRLVQAGRTFWFRGDPTPLRVYALDGRLMYRGTPRGKWEPSRAALPTGVYYYRYGERFGRVSLP